MDPAETPPSDREERQEKSSAPHDPGPPNLVGKARSGALWQGMSFLVGKGLTAATTIVLARILAPNEFGLVAMALVFITLADVVGDAGVAQALIYLKRTREMIRAAGAIAIGTGTLFTVALALAAPLVAQWYGEDRVTGLMRVLAVVVFVNAIASVPEALLRAELQFSRWSVAVAIRSMVVGAVSISLALKGLGAMSLVVGQLSGAVVYLGVLMAMLTSFPDLRFWRARRVELATVLRYGLPIAAAMFLSKVVFDIDYVVVGSLGAEQLGIYTIAFKLPEIAIIQIFYVISSVTYPLYTRASGDHARLARGYLLSMRVQSLYGLSAGVGLAVCAPLVVPVLLGEEWLPAVPVVMVISVYAAIRSLSAGANDVYKALGRPGLSVWISLARLAVLVPALLIGAKWGILGVAVAQTIVASVFVVIMQSLALRFIGIEVANLVRALSPAIPVAAGVGISSGLVVAFFPGAPIIVLALAIFSGGLTGGLISFVTARDALGAIVPALKRKR